MINYEWQKLEREKWKIWIWKWQLLSHFRCLERLRFLRWQRHSRSSMWYRTDSHFLPFLFSFFDCLQFAKHFSFMSLQTYTPVDDKLALATHNLCGIPWHPPTVTLVQRWSIKSFIGQKSALFNFPSLHVCAKGKTC